MTRLTNRLTDRALRTLTRPGRFNDGGGLYAFVSDSGARSWVFRYRSRTSGKHRDKGLGALSVVSLAEARRKAEACRKLLSRGIDPIDREQRARARAAEAAAQRRTFGWCLEQYIASRADAWKNDKHKAQWLNSVTTHASRLIGMDVAAITTDDVLAALEPIWTTKTETASRVRQRIEAVIDWATAKKYRYGDNPARWRGHLQNLLAKPGAIKQVEHREALPYADMPECMSKMATKNPESPITAREEMRQIDSDATKTHCSEVRFPANTAIQAPATSRARTTIVEKTFRVIGEPSMADEARTAYRMSAFGSEAGTGTNVRFRPKADIPEPQGVPESALGLDGSLEPIALSRAASCSWTGSSLPCLNFRYAS